jgi:glyoxylase-like metal-dependent hydrolase (beta-lactamase superfamily II)
VIELAPGVHALGHGAGGRVRAFLIADGGELTLVDPLLERDARLVLEAIHALGRTPSDLKRIGITHAHRSRLGGLAELKHRSGATAYAHPWEADIVGGQRRAQPVTPLPKQSLRLLPFQIGLQLNRPKHTPCPVNEPLEEGDALARVPGCVQHLQRPDRLYGRKPDPPTWNRVNAPHTLPHVPL